MNGMQGTQNLQIQHTAFCLLLPQRLTLKVPDTWLLKLEVHVNANAFDYTFDIVHANLQS